LTLVYVALLLHAWASTRTWRWRCGKWPADAASRACCVPWVCRTFHPRSTLRHSIRRSVSRRLRRSTCRTMKAPGTSSTSMLRRCLRDLAVASTPY
jgi:hypothetical protein